MSQPAMNEKQASLILPCFIRDAENLAYFQQALRSALEQEYANLEILVINDGSPLTDEVESLIELKDQRVRYFRKSNGGVASALNLGLREMRGDYFTWLSHDDLYLPDKVSLQMRQIAGEKEGTILYCDVEHIDAEGGHLFFEQSTDLDSHACRLFFAQYGAHNANAHLIPKKCFDLAGFFNESLRTTQDNDMWFRLSEKFPFKRVPKVLIKYRSHPTQDSRSSIHLQECNALFISFLEHLTMSQILQNSDKTPGHYYAECACVRGNRGYREAERHAAKLAITEFLKHPLREWNSRNFIIGRYLNS